MFEPTISSLKDGYQFLCLGYQRMARIYDSVKNSRNLLNFETRRVQSNGRSLVIVIPKSYTDYLAIERGDLIKFRLQKDPGGRSKVIIEKIHLQNGYDDGTMTERIS